jgi:hypothetical protein
MGTEEGGSGQESGTIQNDEYWFTRIDQESLAKYGHSWMEGLPKPGQYSLDYIILKTKSHVNKLGRGEIDPDDGIPHWTKVAWYRRAYETFNKQRRLR